jgi:hypothetical protein
LILSAIVTDALSTLCITALIEYIIIAFKYMQSISKYFE